MRLLNLLILASVTALGCQADKAATPQAVAPLLEDAAPGPAEEARADEAQGAAARPRAPQAVAPRLAWRWSHYGPEAIRRGAHERRSLSLGASTISLEIGVKPERVVVKRAMPEPAYHGPDGWTYTLEQTPFVTGATLLLAPAAGLVGSTTPPLPGQGELIVLALYSRISSGCELLALDAGTGELRWRRALTALGPVEHSKYRNEVQLDMIDGQIVAYGDEASGRYIEVVDRETGRTLQHARPDARSAAWSSWGAAQDAAGREQVREELEARWSQGLKEAGVGRVSAMLSGTGPIWTVMLGSTQDDREIEVAASDERPFAPSQVAANVDSAAILYAADGPAGRLVGLNGATGQQRWSTPLVGLGAGALEQRVTPWSDSFVVTSEGDAGASLEIVDAASGQLVWHERWFR